MAHTTSIHIQNKSIYLKKVSRAVSKKRGQPFGQLFRKFVVEVIDSYDINDYDHSAIFTESTNYKIEEFPQAVKDKMISVAAKYGIRKTEFFRHLFIQYLNSVPKNQKSFGEQDCD